jgi:hypothetical protein
LPNFQLPRKSEDEAAVRAAATARALQTLQVRRPLALTQRPVLKREIGHLRPEEEISIVHNHLKPNFFWLVRQPVVLLECLPLNHECQSFTLKRKREDQSLQDLESNTKSLTLQTIKRPRSLPADPEETENISTYQLRSVRS